MEYPFSYGQALVSSVAIATDLTNAFEYEEALGLVRKVGYDRLIGESKYKSAYVVLVL